ncbi:DUF1801 domain-containing protein [Aureliella helgolandensis]|uniref:YdhG-like domain-containing protein n=1 Tax=Aureliella helgolandensis TaxID=2527968 RepID=A0A518G107_9BACT|nr:DUF1801 domain-containing protein [Aureliella helgolandensis]QDV22204.1 hypothetical protein Q31a_04870 [Aureliella helgolandensis]
MKIDNPQVKQVFDRYPANIRKRLLRLRALIFEMAHAKGVGPLTETLKWGQPSYLTEQTKAGSTIRIDATSQPGQVAIYFICHTNLVARFRREFPDTLSYDGNRAILIDRLDEIDEPALAQCLAMALTYKVAPNS